MINPPELRRVPLNITIPTHLITFAMVQSSLSVDLRQARFAMSKEDAATQVDLLSNTLALAAPYEASFQIHPEYSMPQERMSDLDHCVEDKLEPNSVLLAGLDSMPYATYHKLTGSPEDVTRANCNQWVNAGVLWVKEADGQVKRFIQPKLVPANAESAIGGMYRGQYIYLFEAGDYRFAFVICRDLIATVSEGGYAVNFSEWLHRSLRDTPLDLLIVIQHNPKPDDERFQHAKQTLLGSGKVTAIAVINQAGQGYGNSGFYVRGPYKFPPDELPFSYSFEKVSSCFRARFRSDEPMLYIAQLQTQEQNAGEASILPVEPVIEHPISGAELQGDGTRTGPYQWAFRTYGGSKHPGHDKDEIPSEQILAELATQYRRVHRELSENQNEDGLRQILQLLFSLAELSSDGILPLSPDVDPRAWNRQRAEVGELVRTLARLSLGGEFQIDESNIAATAKLPWANCDVSVVAGYEDLALRTSLLNVVAWLNRMNGTWLTGPVLFLFLHHKGRGPERAKVCDLPDVAQEATDRFRPELRPIDAADTPSGVTEEQPMLERIDDITEPLLRYLGGKRLEDLESLESLDAVKQALKEVFQ